MGGGCWEKIFIAVILELCRSEYYSNSDTLVLITGSSVSRLLRLIVAVWTITIQFLDEVQLEDFYFYFWTFVHIFSNGKS